MKFDMGTAWVLRRFAKPIVTGSIPAHVSIFRPLYGQRWMGRGHRYQLGQAFSGWIARLDGAFGAGMAQGVLSERAKLKDRRQSMSCPAERIVQFHQMAVEARTELSELREKYTALSKELSKLKRTR